MSFADNRHNVMLAMAFQADILHQDDIIIPVHFLEGTSENIRWILGVSTKELGECIDKPLGGVDQTLARRVFAEIG